MNTDTQQRPPAARVGVFSIDLAAYWPQFEGLRERLEGYQCAVEQRLASFGAEVASAGLVDTSFADAGDMSGFFAGPLEKAHALTIDPALV
jgi:L-arabinose isomerase